MRFIFFLFSCLAQTQRACEICNDFIFVLVYKKTVTSYQLPSGIKQQRQRNSLLFIACVSFALIVVFVPIFSLRIHSILTNSFCHTFDFILFFWIITIYCVFFRFHSFVGTYSLRAEIHTSIQSTNQRKKWKINFYQNIKLDLMFRFRVKNRINTEIESSK